MRAIASRALVPLGCFVSKASTSSSAHEECLFSGVDRNLLDIAGLESMAKSLTRERGSKPNKASACRAAESGRLQFHLEINNDLRFNATPNLPGESVSFLHPLLEAPMASPLPLFRIAALSMGWFDSLPDDVKAAVHARCTRIAVPHGRRLFTRGQQSDAVYCVLDGAVRVSGMSSDGQETVLDFYGTGIWFGEVSVLDGLPRTHDARSETDCVLLQLSKADLEDLLANYPAFSRGLLTLQALRLRLLLTAIESYSIQPLEKRLASRLLMLAVNFAAGEGREAYLDLHLPQETLAQLIGSTRQRVNQIFKDWEASGLASQQYGRVLLIDRAGLEALAAI